MNASISLFSPDFKQSQRRDTFRLSQHIVGSVVGDNQVLCLHRNVLVPEVLVRV